MHTLALPIGYDDFGELIDNHYEFVIDYYARKSKREGHLLENITSASILTWQHVNLHGMYDLSVH